MSKQNGHEPVVHKPLTAKQQRFCEVILANGGNATQAAVSAGYKAKSAGQMASENLKKPHIALYLQQMRGDLTERTGHSAEQTINDFAEIANNRDVHLGYRLKALELLGKTQGIFIEKRDVHHSGSIADGTGGLQATMDLVEAINATADSESLPQSLQN